MRAGICHTQFPLSNNRYLPDKFYEKEPTRHYRVRRRRHLVRLCWTSSN